MCHLSTNGQILPTKSRHGDKLLVIRYCGFVACRLWGVLRFSHQHTDHTIYHRPQRRINLSRFSPFSLSAVYQSPLGPLMLSLILRSRTNVTKQSLRVSNLSRSVGTTSSWPKQLTVISVQQLTGITAPKMRLPDDDPLYKPHNRIGISKLYSIVKVS